MPSAVRPFPTPFRCQLSCLPSDSSDAFLSPVHVLHSRPSSRTLRLSQDKMSQGEVSSLLPLPPFLPASADSRLAGIPRHSHVSLITASSISSFESSILSLLAGNGPRTARRREPTSVAPFPRRLSAFVTLGQEYKVSDNSCDLE